MSGGGAWSLFGRDVEWSAGVCWRSPLVPLIWVLGAVPALTETSAAFSILLLPIFLLLGGFCGTVRLFFAGTDSGRPSLTGAEIWSATCRYVGRFLCLGLVASVVLLPVALLTYGLGEEASAIDVLATSLVIMVLDVAGTFVTPALALSTGRVTEAVRLGWRVLREGWPQHRWHALVPPLALQVVAATSLHSLNLAVQVGIQLVAGIIGIVLRGATTKAYLRSMPMSETGPSWLDGRPRDPLVR